MREQYACPLALTHDMIRGKWKPIIIFQLGVGLVSLSQLEWTGQHIPASTVQGAYMASINGFFASVIHTSELPNAL